MVTGALAFVFGLIGATIITMPNRKDNEAKINSVKNEARKEIEETQDNLENAKVEILRLTSELEKAKVEINRLRDKIEYSNNKLGENGDKVVGKIETIKGNNISQEESKNDSQGVSAQSNIIIVSKPMFGIFLGETLDSLRKRFNVSKSNLYFEDEDHPGKILSVRSDNPNVKQLLVYTFNGNVYTIYVLFNDGSRTNYETINAQLEKTYKSSDKGGLSGAIFGEGVFETVIDGMEIRIKLNHDIGFMEDDKLELSYTHVLLSERVYEEIKSRKSAKINKDLWFWNLFNVLVITGNYRGEL